MEISHIALYKGLTFLACATGFIVLVVGGFLAKLAFDLSKLTKNIDETTSIIKAEIGPTLNEVNKALQSINSIAQNADKQVNTLGKAFENALGVGAVAFGKAKELSGGLFKGFIKGLATVIKMFINRKF